MPSTKAWISSLPKPSITFSRARRGVPPSTSTAPATSIFPTPLRPAGTTTGSVLGAERNDRLVGLDDAAQRLALRVDHGPAQLGAQHPGGSVRAEAELALQLHGRDAVGVRRHQKRRPEPPGQRQLAGVHDGPGRHRGLPAAGGTFIGEGLGLQKPGPAVAATGADEPFRPTACEQVFRTCAFARKAALELDQRLGKPALGPRHDLTLLILDGQRPYLCVPVLYTTFRRTGCSCISSAVRCPTKQIGSMMIIGMKNHSRQSQI